MASPAESAAAEEAANENGAAAAEVEDGEGSENFQGPHKWRQHLRHVNVPKFENGDKLSDTDDSKETTDR